jgi:hypothetical protein
VKLCSYFISFFLLTLSLYGAHPKQQCNFTPVFYGTLLEFSSTNNAPGVLTLQPALYGGIAYGSYDDHWNVSGESLGIVTPQIFAYLGVTQYLQLAVVVQTQTIWYKGRSTTSFGDSTLSFGWQFLWEQKNTPKPNVRLDTIAVFPTGKYQRLGNTFNGKNSSGYGSYGTLLAFIIDKTFYPDPCHPFNINISTGYAYLGKTNLHGINTYGGGPDTHGVLHPGPRTFLFFALEYYITADLNFALDVQYTHSFPNSFHGFIGNAIDGSPASILTAPTDILAIAPAVEIAFSPTMAFYVGGYFTAAGRNALATAEGNLTFIISF